MLPTGISRALYIITTLLYVGPRGLIMGVYYLFSIFQQVAKRFFVFTPYMRRPYVIL